MNLNYKISEIQNGGIPGYNDHLNDMIRCINWMLGMRTSNGNPISESSSGPVIDLGE
jgi:hypothetical protein